MTYLTQRFLQRPILRSQFLRLALISLLLIVLQATPAGAQGWTTNNGITTTNDKVGIGIGTTNPTYKLVVGPDIGYGLTTSDLTVSRGPGQSVSAFVGASGSNGMNFGWDQANQRAFVNAPVQSPITFTHGGVSERMRISADGNVGIGTINPGAKLEVLGNVNVIGTGTGAGNITAAGTITGGTIYAKYQDVAEWVPASEQIPAGTVVVLDSTKSNHVISSTIGYDTRVAGVISEKPGIALGESGNGKVLVATTGRVRAKVDATQGPIQIGDLLVTSDKAGVAMKSQPLNLAGVQIHRPGTLIGKALEPLAKGQGEILVLLSLQ